MPVPLLKTKTHIPAVRPGFVPRPHLVEQLMAGVRSGSKLILISAPAGFGKTTLLSEWVHRDEPETHTCTAWLSLGQGDNDPTRFWSYVIATLQAVVPGLGQTALMILESTIADPGKQTAAPAMSTELVLTTLVNEISETISRSRRSLLLVLDDYHVINTPEIHQALEFLIEHLPPMMHVIIACRADPPLSLSRLRGRNQLTELRTIDLRFAPYEAAAFLNQTMGLGLSTEHIAALEAQTEGWIVGLQMAALALQKQDSDRVAGFMTAFAGSHRYVLEYLTDEVFALQPDEIRHFLLKTSILERLTGPLCDAILYGRHPTGQDGQRILEYLERANLFIVPLDDRHEWYRYHHLFADLLRKRLGSAHAEWIPALHRRASEWYASHGLVDEAISHALAIPDHERAADLVEGHILLRISQSESTLARRWLEALPEDTVRSRPLLCVAQAWSTLFPPRANTDRAEQWMHLAEETSTTDTRSMVQAGVPYRTMNDLVACQAAAFQAIVARRRGRPPQTVIDLSLQALDSVPKKDLTSRSLLAMQLGLAYLDAGNEGAADRAFVEARQMGTASNSHYAAFVSAYARATITRQRGQLCQATRICREALQTVSGAAVPIAGAVHVLLGQILLEQNDLEAAHQELIIGLKLVCLSGEAEPQVNAQITLARLKCIRGDASGIRDLDEQAEKWRSGYGAYIAAHQARMWLMLAAHAPGHLAHAVRWAKERGIRLDDTDPTGVQSLTLARVLIAQYRAGHLVLEQTEPQSLLHWLGERHLYAMERGWNEQVIEILVLLSLALSAIDFQGQMENQGDNALIPLEHALSLAEPERYVRIFVDEGRPMARLLYRVAERGTASQYARKLLATIEAQLTDIESSDRDRGQTDGVRPHKPLIEPLSEREIEVLQWIAIGLTNREIAQELVIAHGTVKVHVSNIYRKLDVHSRTQAVARATALGILSTD